MITLTFPLKSSGNPVTFTVALPSPGITDTIISSGLTVILSTSIVSSFGMNVSSYIGLLVMFTPLRVWFPGVKGITSIPVPFITGIG